MIHTLGQMLKEKVVDIGPIDIIRKTNHPLPCA